MNSLTSPFCSRTSCLMYNGCSLDIDTIEIRSEDEEGSGAAKQRRNYNYKVSDVATLRVTVAC